MSTYKLQTSPTSLAQGLTNASTAITSVYFTSNEQVAIITFDTGLVSSYDVRAGFTWLGDIEKEVSRAF